MCMRADACGCTRTGIQLCLCAIMCVDASVRRGASVHEPLAGTACVNAWWAAQQDNYCAEDFDKAMS